LTNFLSRATCDATMLSWSDELTPRGAILSMRVRSSTRSTKPTRFDTAVPDGQKPWRVELHREVGKDVACYGLCDPSFSPTLGELISALEANPKQFPKKSGKLKTARAAELKFKGVTYRAVFVLDESARVVSVLALDPHDAAYKSAIARGRRPRG
jgi:mRNA-degrading endonuclease RelE of RelBE toxin-antitoxin system